MIKGTPNGKIYRNIRFLWVLNFINSRGMPAKNKIDKN
jgi:hypothetical protein